MTPDSLPASRRNFLASSSAAVAAANLDWLPGNLHAAGSDVIRIGLVGCGGRGTGAAINAMNAGKDVRLVAMGDLLLDRAQEKRNALKVKKPGQVEVSDDRCFSGYDAYKKVIASGVDVVLIANAAKFHPLHLTAAIQAGKHVFVEKPNAIDPAGVKMVAAACELAREKRLSVVAGMQSRYHPGYRETMRRVHEGAIGNIVAIHENFLRAPYVLYQRKPGLTEVEWQGSNQYHFHWLSGDDVPQSLVHNLDRATWALREEPPVRCYGMGGRSTLRGMIYGSTFDHHAIVYDYASGVRLFAFCRTIPDCYRETCSIYMGTKGRCDVLRMTITGETNWKYQGPQADATDLEHVELFQSIRSGNPVNNGSYMARSTMVAVMGQISCYTGEEITWERISKSDFHYPPRPEDVRADMEPPVKPDAEGIYPVYTPGVTRLL